MYVCLCMCECVGVETAKFYLVFPHSLCYLLSANNIFYNYTIFLLLTFIKPKKKNNFSLKCPISVFFIIIKGLFFYILRYHRRLFNKSEEISFKCVFSSKKIFL